VVAIALTRVPASRRAMASALPNAMIADGSTNALTFDFGAVPRIRLTNRMGQDDGTISGLRLSSPMLEIFDAFFNRICSSRIVHRDTILVLDPLDFVLFQRRLLLLVQAGS
jgi:hypothetical protein